MPLVPFWALLVQLDASSNSPTRSCSEALLVSAAMRLLCGTYAAVLLCQHLPVVATCSAVLTHSVLIAFCLLCLSG
jgi:hypothetical protein